MQTKHTFEMISADQLSTATGGTLCHRESMGYQNAPGTCQDFWSTAPMRGQNGWKGLDSAGRALPADQLKVLNQGRSNLGEAPISAGEASAASREFFSGR